MKVRKQIIEAFKMFNKEFWPMWYVPFTNYKLARKYVFVVLECSGENNDEHIHGVFINRAEAEGKAQKISNRPGHIAVLKLPLSGASLW